MQKLTRTELFSLILIIILQFVSVAAANMLIPSYASVIDYFKVDNSVVGLPDSVFVLVSAIFAVFWGYFSDRIDRSRIVTIGAILWSVGTLMTAFNNIQTQLGFELLIVARAITGAGMGSIIPVASSVMGDIVPAEDRTTWFGAMAILSSISNGVGQALSSFLAPLTNMGFRFPFLIISLMSVGVIILLIFVKIPERGSHEEDLASLQDLEMEYMYQLSKRDLKKILVKKTNLAIFIQGFFAIIPGTLVVYFLTTMFSDSSIGLFRILPDDIRLQISTIMAGLVGVGYIVGNYVLAYIGDVVYKKNKRNRALMPALAILIAVPMCITFILSAPELDSQILAYADENMFVILIQIFKLYPSSIIYVVTAFIGSFFSSAGVSARSAVLMDVNLPEHRGTTTSLFSLAEQLGKSLTLSLSYFLLTFFSTYQQMIIFAALFWIPTGFIWYFASRTVISDMNEKSLVLKERTQLTFIDYFFELEIKLDQAVQYIYDARRYIGKNNQKSHEYLQKSVKIFQGIESMAKRKEMIELEQKVHNFSMKALLLEKDFKSYLKKFKIDSDSSKEEAKQLRLKIEEEWEPSDLGKIEILYDSGNLKIIESRLQRKYDIFKSIRMLREAEDIFQRVNLLSSERLIDPDAKKLTSDEKEFQNTVENLIARSKKSHTDARRLKERLENLIEELSEEGISKEKLVDTIDRALEIHMPYTEVIIDFIPRQRGQREIQRLIKNIDRMFDDYDNWSQ